MEGLDIKRQTYACMYRRLPSQKEIFAQLLGDSTAGANKVAIR